MEELIKYLEEIAKEKTFKEDPDYSPSDDGNFDDTFEQGESDGKVLFAREILEKIEQINKDKVLEIIKKS